MISAALSHHERGTDGVESFGSYLVSMRKMPGSLMAVVLFSPDSAKRYPELGPDQVRIMSADAAQILYTSRCL